MALFTNGVPPTGVTAASPTQEISSIFSPTTFLPFGRQALNRISGTSGIKEVEEAEKSDFPDELVIIPIDVTPENLHKFNYYQLLGFTGDLADSADVEAIRRAYRKAVLVYHPDKTANLNKDAEGNEDNAVFLKIQEGFNLLCNEQRRRTYDSQLPFDETVPTDEIITKKMKKNPEKFFKLYDPVFKRNARFAVKKPVPEIGDFNTPINEVYRFYEYWINFESWRDFSGMDSEHKPDEATSRDEKRWMQKENDRIGKKLKKKEMDRIIDMVMLSQKRDPRIVADKEAKKSVKEAEKAAKENEANKKQREEEAAKLEQERIDLESKEFAAATKVDREKLKKLLSKGRNILRKLLRHTLAINLGDGAYGILKDEEMELLCTYAEFDELTKMNDSMGGEAATKDTSLFKSEGTTIVMECFELAKQKKIDEAEQQKIAREAAKNGSVSTPVNSPVKGGSSESREWNRDNLSFLAKAVAKYPAGYANRWGCVSTYMNDQLKPSLLYTQDECIKTAFNAGKNAAVPKK